MSSDYPDGYWQVGQNKFTNKYQALLRATSDRLPINYYWRHDVWSNFNTQHLGNISLKELYKRRAQQLREKYDYIILMYSGGSDSWTVLNTFLENNIRLDSLCVRWTMNTVGTYVPNPNDTSAFNHRSEWDLVIHKDLLWLSQHYPNIKLEIADWFKDNKLHPMTDDYFLSQNVWYQAVNIHRGNAYPESWYYHMAKGKRVCCLYGAEKPMLLHLGGGRVVMCFFDSMVVQGFPIAEGHISNGIEYFYWAPDFPRLVFEQAHQLFLFYKNNSNMRYVIDETDYDTHRGLQPLRAYLDDLFDMRLHHAKLVLYPDWDFSRFQALKPRSLTREDKDFWFYTHPELQREVQVWRNKYTTMLKSVHPGLLQPEGNAFKSHRTPYYDIGNYND